MRGQPTWSVTRFLGPSSASIPPLPAISEPLDLGYVVVLGSGYIPHDGIPVSGALDEDGLSRIVEGVVLFRRVKSARLVASGGASPGLAPSAIGYAQLATELGVASESLLVVDRPLDTAEEALTTAAVVGKSPFILVTSAYHMPRAMRLFLRKGLRPIPAPTGYRESGPGAEYWTRMIPSGLGLRKVERALHEYLGLAAIALDIQ